MLSATGKRNPVLILRQSTQRHSISCPALAAFLYSSQDTSLLHVLCCHLSQPSHWRPYCLALTSSLQPMHESWWAVVSDNIVFFQQPTRCESKYLDFYVFGWTFSVFYLGFCKNKCRKQTKNLLRRMKRFSKMTTHAAWMLWRKLVGPTTATNGYLFIKKFTNGHNQISWWQKRKTVIVVENIWKWCACERAVTNLKVVKVHMHPWIFAKKLTLISRFLLLYLYMVI